MDAVSMLHETCGQSLLDIEVHISTFVPRHRLFAHRLPRGRTQHLILAIVEPSDSSPQILKACSLLAWDRERRVIIEERPNGQVVPIVCT